MENQPEEIIKSKDDAGDIMETKVEEKVSVVEKIEQTLNLIIDSPHGSDKEEGENNAKDDPFSFLE